MKMQVRVRLCVKMQIAECDLGGAAQCSGGLRHVSAPAWIKPADRTISLRLRTLCSLTNFLAEQIQTCPRPGQLGRVHQNQDGFLRADGIFQLQRLLDSGQCLRRPHDTHRRIFAPEWNQRLDLRVEVAKPLEVCHQKTNVDVLCTDPQ